MIGSYPNRFNVKPLVQPDVIPCRCQYPQVVKAVVPRVSVNVVDDMLIGESEQCAYDLPGPPVMVSGCNAREPLVHPHKVAFSGTEGCSGAPELTPGSWLAGLSTNGTGYNNAVLRDIDPSTLENLVDPLPGDPVLSRNVCDPSMLVVSSNHLGRCFWGQMGCSTRLFVGLAHGHNLQGCNV